MLQSSAGSVFFFTPPNSGCTASETSMRRTASRARLFDGGPAPARQRDVRRPAQNLLAQLVPKTVRQRQRQDQRRHPARDPDERRARSPLHHAAPPPHPQIPEREKEFERHKQNK